jgi:hypothetical protein
MLENPDAGDDLGCGGGRPALQALLHRLHERGNAARAHILQTARAQRPGPGGQLAQLTVLVVASDGLDLRGIPVQTGDKVSPGVLIPYRYRTSSVYGTVPYSGTECGVRGSNMAQNSFKMAYKKVKTQKRIGGSHVESQDWRKDGVDVKIKSKSKSFIFPQPIRYMHL